MNTIGLCGISSRSRLSYCSSSFVWSSSLIADEPIAELELYVKSIIRTGFGREVGRKSLS